MAEMGVGAATMEDSIYIPQKVKVEQSQYPAFVLDKYPKKVRSVSRGDIGIPTPIETLFTQAERWT